MAAKVGKLQIFVWYRRRDLWFMARQKMFLTEALVNSQTPHTSRGQGHLLVGVGFTLIETIVALGLMAIVVGAVTYALVSALQVAEENEDLAIAEGLAQDLMNEILNRRYCELGASPYDPYLRPGSNEKHPGTRELFDDIDDYNGWVEEPPQDRWGIPLGEEDGLGGQRPLPARAANLNGFRREVLVSYVSPQDFSKSLPFGTVSGFRKIEVIVSRRYPNNVLRQLVKLTRVVGHVPSEQF